MKINLIGVPSNSGGLYSGTEMTPDLLRTTGILDIFDKKGLSLTDLGNVNINSYLPRHNYGPIRNWPSPRIIWDEINIAISKHFDDDNFLLILGGDCSIVTGTVNSLYNYYGENLYLISIDAHLDALKPSVENCVGAAAMGLWFLCNDNMFVRKPSKFNGRNITVLGTQQEYDETYGINLVGLQEVRHKGIAQVVTRLLSNLPTTAKIFIHLDVDAICKEELYAVYAPSNDGFTLKECENLLAELIKDERVFGMEVAEFSGIKDPEGNQSALLNDLLANTFKYKNLFENN